MSFNDILSIAMLGGMLAFIFIGFPIAFTLLFIALVLGSIGIGVNITFSLAYLQIFGTMKDDILPAVPLFIFMGYMTEQAGLMNRLFGSMRQIMAPLNGSLFLAVLLTATIFAMATGIVGAAVTVLGIMAGPMMIKAGYDEKLSAGAIAAGGTLGILIPPSVMLVVMGPTLGVPVNQLYGAAMAPGFMLAVCYATYCVARSYVTPRVGPPLPIEEQVGSAIEIVHEFVVGVLPLCLLIVATLGSILSGLATPTEAASCGAVGATILALAYRKLSLGTLKNAAMATVVTSSMVLLLAVASNVFGAVFTQLGGAAIITDVVTSIPVSDMWKLVIIMAIIFALGWPFEWPAIVLVFLPIFTPIVLQLDLGLTKPELLLWFGVLVAVNLQTAYLSSPVAMSAYFLKNVVPQWSLKSIYRGMGQFMVIQIVFLIALLMWPSLVLWVPSVLK
ncbi:TRAP transporter large permease [Sinorhizobium prairiense]|uniref:TRAP transporter large permease n=1 Tax=unclassified Sinorhizobium TaxID=2613772 RepID=UPI0023D7F9C6|nr:MULTISPECIES: TRAP transporter large permease subunit [unclassified Sinorhizobium]WEJ08743.1 TRAP transporter large permease subunit [Sinorhizobium sp. M103]WEJ35354.1 TRAP transporter large permease subunit [Sinorhizobium sp. C101]